VCRAFLDKLCFLFSWNVAQMSEVMWNHYESQPAVLSARALLLPSLLNQCLPNYLYKRTSCYYYSFFNSKNFNVLGTWTLCEFYILI
jgi:hypothetical protein